MRSWYQPEFTTPPPFPVQSWLGKLLFFFSFFSSFLLEERCRFLSNFTTSTAEVELPGEFLMPKANTVSILWIIILSLGSTAKEDSEWQFKATITEKSSDTFASLGRFPIHTGLTPLPSPHKQCWTRVSRIVSEFHSVWGNPEMREKYEYFPKNFCPWL